MPELQPSPVLLMPQVSLADEINSTLPLEYTEVSAQVSGPVASVAVRQRFGNPLQSTAELDYLFPLPEAAAITGFELTIGQQVIRGELQESQAARTAYEDARGQGKRAGLFEQRRPNLFAVRLANVGPGETIEASLRYQQRLAFEEDATSGAGTYTFVYPMGITPRYDSPAAPGEGEGAHAPVARANEPVGPVDIELSIDAGLPLGEPVSPSHSLEVTRIDERRVQVRVPETRPDHDFVLRLPLATAQFQAAAWLSAELTESASPDSELFLATLLPPRLEVDASPPPREFIFVLDRSGSMSGDPIRQARNALRACLRALNPGDTFRVLLFDHLLEWFQSEPAPVTQDQVDLADRFLSQVEGRGGTEIVGALEAALSLPPDPTRTRFVVFLTDGAVSAEKRALDQVRQKLGQARLFSFGIGSSVNRALLNQMAAQGRGQAAFLQLDEDIEGAIIRFQDSVSFPAMSDITLEWEDAKAWDLYPARLPDLYHGQPLEICGRLARTGSQPALLLRGQRDGQPVTVRLALQPPPGTDRTIGRVWARARVDALLEQAQLEPHRADELRQQIIGLALKYQLVTAFTSFVAVDSEVTTASGQPRVIHVSQPLPKGVSFDPLPPPMLVASMVQPAAFFGGPSRSRAMSLSSSEPQAPPPPSARHSMADRLQSPESTTDSAPMPRAARPYPAASPAGEGGPPSLLTGQDALRWLARTQNLDGSWHNDIEWTAAALLAFVRAGHTPRAGSFRQALRRVARWLVEHPGQGQAAFLRAHALQALAEASGDENDRAAAQAARLALPAPSSQIEQAALGQPVTPPARLRTLDDLRLAVLLDEPLPGDLQNQLELPPGQPGELAQVWAAALREKPAAKP